MCVFTGILETRRNHYNDLVLYFCHKCVWEELRCHGCCLLRTFLQSYGYSSIVLCSSSMGFIPMTEKKIQETKTPTASDKRKYFLTIFFIFPFQLQTHHLSEKNSVLLPMTPLQSTGSQTMSSASAPMSFSTPYSLARLTSSVSHGVVGACGQR